MQVIKRNGEIAEFDPDKIYQAVLKMCIRDRARAPRILYR